MFQQALFAIWTLLTQAAASLPIVAALTLVAGRRGEARAALYGASLLANFGVCLASLATPYYLASYLREVLHFNAPWRQMLAPLLSAPGMPWLSATLAWLAGLIFFAFGAWRAAKKRAGFSADKLPVKNLKSEFASLLAAGACFFASFILINWPFAGLPEGLAQDQAYMAIFRKGFRDYFLAFCPAGALSLTAFNYFARTWPPRLMPQAARWLSFWALAGCAPTLLIAWGTITGLSMRGSGVLARMSGHISALFCLSAALCLWAFILWKPKFWRPLGLAACAALIASALAPIMLK